MVLLVILESRNKSDFPIEKKTYKNLNNLNKEKDD